MSKKELNLQTEITFDPGAPHVHKLDDNTLLAIMAAIIQSGNENPSYMGHVYNSLVIAGLILDKAKEVKNDK